MPIAIALHPKKYSKKEVKKYVEALGVQLECLLERDFSHLDGKEVVLWLDFSFKHPHSARTMTVHERRPS